MFFNIPLVVERNVNDHLLGRCDVQKFHLKTDLETDFKIN